MGPGGAQVDGTSRRKPHLVEVLPHDLRVDERLHVAGKLARDQAVTVRQCVIVEQARLVLVVDDDGMARRVDVDAVDAADEVGAGIVDGDARRPAKAHLEEPWLEALKDRHLELERRAKVVAQSLELLVLRGHVRNERLVGALVGPHALMCEVCVELGVEQLGRTCERGRVHAGARQALARVAEGVGGRPKRREARCLAQHRAVRDLQDAVHERALLEIGEAGVDAVEAEPAQGEPLVRALEVGLDL